MPQAFRVRLGDGSVIDLDREALRSWYEKGLVRRDTQVQTPGSRAWVGLSQATDVRQWRAPAVPAGRSAAARPAARAAPSKARPAPSSTPRPSAPAVARRRPSPSLDLPWGRYAGLTVAAAAVAGALYATSAWWSPLVFGLPEERSVKAAATGERRLGDDALGLTLELPGKWLLLRESHGLFAPPPNARLSAADPSAGAYGYLAVDTPARGLSLDTYLTQVLQERRRSEPSLREVRREDVPGQGRRAVATRQAGEVATDEVVTGWKDGWTYYALVVWAPTERASAVDAASALREGITTQGALGARLRQAVETVSQEVPLLTPAAAEMLMGQSQAQMLEPAEAFRRTYLLAGRGLPLLPRDDQKEMGALSSDLYAALPPGERARLGGYIERVRAGRATDPALDQQMSRVVKTAVLKLPPAKRLRLQAVFEKALTAGIG
jgi:hypothetical protein